MADRAHNFNEAVQLIVKDSDILSKVVNGTSLETVTIEDGTEIPTLRKTLIDNFKFKDPIDWVQGESESEFLQIRRYSDGTMWYAPNARKDLPTPMGVSPVGDDNWVIAITSADLVTKLWKSLANQFSLEYKGYYKKGGSVYTNFDDVYVFNDGFYGVSSAVTLPYTATEEDPTSDRNLILRGGASKLYVDEEIKSATMYKNPLTQAIDLKINYKINEILSTRDFEENGNVDKITALRNALDYVCVNGGHLYVAESYYEIDKPIVLKQKTALNAKVNTVITFNSTKIVKTTNSYVDDTSSPRYISIYGGYINANTNSVITSENSVTYMVITGGLYLESSTGASKAMHILQGNNNQFEYIQTKNCSVDFETYNMWMSGVKHYRGNESTGKGFHFNDERRVNADGSGGVVSVQTGTSFTFEHSYINSSAGVAYDLNRLDYSNFVVGACDHSGGYAYSFNGCRGVGGVVGSESNASTMMYINNSNVNLTINTLDDAVQDSNYYIISDGDSACTIGGHFRTEHKFLAQAKSSSYIKFLPSTTWNGSTSLHGIITGVNSGVVEWETSSDLERYTAEGVTYQTKITKRTGAGKNGKPSYCTDRVKFEWMSSDKRSTFTIPISEVQKVIPNFGISNGYLSEVVRINVMTGQNGHFGYFYAYNNNQLIGDAVRVNDSASLTKINSISKTDTDITITIDGEIDYSCIEVCRS